MSRCPSCSYLVPESWDVCKKCGAVLRAAAAVAPSTHARVMTPDAPPRSAPTAAAPDFDLLPGRRTRREPARPGEAGDLLPTTVPARTSLVTVKVAETPTRATSRRPGRLVVIGGLVLVAAAAAWMLWPSSGGNGAVRGGGSDDMVILPSPEDAAGTPGVEGALRVEAEAAVQQAIVFVSQALAEYADPSLITPELLAQYDPSLQFVVGADESTAAGVVSLRVAPDAITVAVAGRGDICAFGRVDANMVTDRVTVRMSSCRADGAPATGWYGDTGGGGFGPVAPAEAS